MLHLPTHFFMLWIWTIIVKIDISVLKRIYGIEWVEQYDRTWSKKINMGIRRDRACLKWVLSANRDFGRTFELNGLEGCISYFEPTSNVGFTWERRYARLPFGKTLRQCIFECVLHPLFCVRNPDMLGSYGRVYGLVRATQVNHFVLRVGTGRHSVIWFTGCLFFHFEHATLFC